MRIRTSIAPILAGLLLAGCQNNGLTAGSGSSGPGGSKPGGSGAASPGPGSPTAAGTSAGDKPASPQTPPPVLPDDLKTAAYHWYGLGYDKAVPMKLTDGTGAQYAGTQAVHLKSVAGGKAEFDVERTGDFGDKQGNDTLSLEKGGVYTVGSTLIKGPTRNLELPGDVHPGSTWTDTGKFQMLENGSPVDVSQNLDSRAVDIEKVTTGAGDQQALLVKQEGTMTLNSTKYRIVFKAWYVKDKGVVKSVANMKAASDPKAKAIVITLEETK